MIKVKKLNPDAKVPVFAHNTDSGADLFVVEPLRLKPGKKGIAKTGIAIALPEGFGATIRNKSGNTVKGVLVDVLTPSFVNDSYDIIKERVDIFVHLGTIDNAYRGEVGIMVQNNSKHLVEIPKGTKLAQLVLEKIYQEEFVVVEELDETDRGEGGFGSTGN